MVCQRIFQSQRQLMRKLTFSSECCQVFIHLQRIPANSDARRAAISGSMKVAEKGLGFFNTSV